MSEHEGNTNDRPDLKRRAELALAQKALESTDISTLSDDELEKLIHESQVHQIELEMQNEELRTAQIKLEELKDRYLDLYDLAPVGYLSLNDKGLILEVNLTAVRLLGEERQNLIERPLSRFVSPEFGDAFYFHLQRVFESRSRQIGEIELARKDGSKFHAQLESLAVQGKNGEFSQCRTVLLDITQRKKDAETAWESERKYRELVDNANSAIIRWGRDSTIKFCNEFAQTFFGYTADELIGRHVNILLPEKDSTGSDLSTLVQEIVNQPDRYLNTINENICRDGRRVLMTWTNKPIRDDEGQVVEILAVGSDITAQKRLEAALRESEKRFRSMFQLHDAVMLLIEPENGQIIDANLSAQRFYGYQTPEILGMSIQQINALSPEEIARDRQMALSRERNQFIFPHRLASGEVRTVEVHSSPIDLEGRRVLFSIVHDITDRKQAEDSLRESEQRFRAVIDNVEVGISLLNTDMEIVEINKAMRNSFPHVRPGCGQICYEHYNDPPRQEPCFYCPCILTLQDGEVHEAITETPSGSEDRRYHIVSSPIEDSYGRVQYVIELVQDITDLKMSEELLLVRMNLLEYASTHSLDELLQKTLDEIGALTNSPIGFYHFISEDEKTIYLQMWSSRTLQEFCKAEGKGRHYPVDQGGVWVDAVRERRPLIHNDYPSLSHRKGLPEGHAPLTRELVVPIMRSDKIVAVLGIGNKPTNYTEKDVEVVSYLADVAWEIAQRKRTEESLKESDKQYRTLFEDSIDGVYSVLRDGTITDANPSFCELFGYTREEVIGKDIREWYLDPADRPRFQKEIEKKGFVKDYELRWRKRDGTEVDCVLTSSVHFAKDGNIIGYRGIVRDITERKALQRQLFQAHKMEAVGTLAGGIAHDFNNLLQVVLGYSELVLADGDLPDRLKSDLEKILLSARNGADLVHRLLTFSRKAEIRPLHLDLNQRIRQTERFLERTIPKMIHIELVLTEDLDRIYADPIQIDQILMNLAINSRDAMAEGGRLVIETANVSLDEEGNKVFLGVKPGKYVLLTVSDTGHGIDREALDHIFEPFYTTKEAGEGTGLGLAMVYGIVHQHGGHITCYSEPGEGTTFKIYFPAVEMEMSPDVATTGTMQAFGTGTILLVDDEELIRNLGRRILERSGYTVLTAASGKEALELYRRERGRISLVILDVIMPEMGGKQCLEQLLRIDPNARILIASGYSGGGPAKDALQRGAKGFVSKPFAMRQLLKDIRKALDNE